MILVKESLKWSWKHIFGALKYRLTIYEHGLSTHKLLSNDPTMGWNEGQSKLETVSWVASNYTAALLHPLLIASIELLLQLQSYAHIADYS